MRVVRAGDTAKCRACVCVNFAPIDPTQQSWTAQAEPSSLLCSLKLAVKNKWMISKHDVKGAFLNASLPKGQLVVVQPPDLWVKWGLVPAGVTWTLDKAVYGLRESPFLWSQERDKQLTAVRWAVGEKSYLLRQGDGDRVKRNGVDRLWTRVEVEMGRRVGGKPQARFRKSEAKRAFDHRI